MSNNDPNPDWLKLGTKNIQIILRFNDKQKSVWNTCINEAVIKAKLSSTIISATDVEEIILELEYLKFKQ